MLGILYGGGNGVTEDYEESIKWIRKAAEQGETRALDFLDLLDNKWTVTDVWSLYLKKVRTRESPFTSLYVYILSTHVIN